MELMFDNIRLLSFVYLLSYSQFVKFIRTQVVKQSFEKKLQFPSPWEKVNKTPD